MSLDLFGADDLQTSSEPTLDDVRAGRAVLKSGMHGEAVNYVQAMTGAVADGDFGPKTVTAVKLFQAANGLTADGVVGRDTMLVIDRLAGREGIKTPQASKPNGTSKKSLAELQTTPATKKTSPWVYAGIAVGGLLAVGGGIWVAAK